MIAYSAGIEDRVAARPVLMRLFCGFDSITMVFADGGYTRQADRIVVPAFFACADRKLTTPKSGATTRRR